MSLVTIERTSSEDLDAVTRTYEESYLLTEALGCLLLESGGKIIIQADDQNWESINRTS